MSSRTAVLLAIVDQVQANKLNKNPIDVIAAARNIASLHPHCEMAIEEIEQLIAGMAAKAGVAVLEHDKAA
jgi:hypothetical protein